MTKTHRHLFVYGTLRKDAGHPMHAVLVRHASLVGRATVRATLYSLGEYPGLVPSQDGADFVKGEVYHIEDSGLERTLSFLDDYEGLGPGNPPPHQFRREMVSAKLDDGREVDAWAYVLNQAHAGLRRIRSGDFVKWRRLRRKA